jgi:cell division inhibitor SulA
VNQVVAIAEVLRDPRVWQGPRHTAPRTEPTGYAALDAVLPGGGLPVGALIEILHEFDGTQELSVLLPLLVRTTRARHRVVFVNPPYIPYAPALAAAGVDTAYVHTIPHCAEHALWAAEQCLRSATCATVACWPKPQVGDKALRRLQLAAEAGKALGAIFRPLRAAMSASPAAVRLRADADGIQVLKCRGGIARAQRIRLSPAAQC